LGFIGCICLVGGGLFTCKVCLFLDLFRFIMRTLSRVSIKKSIRFATRAVPSSSTSIILTLPMWLWIKWMKSSASHTLNLILSMWKNGSEIRFWIDLFGGFGFRWVLGLGGTQKRQFLKMLIEFSSIHFGI